MKSAASAALVGLVLVMVVPACGGDQSRAEAPSESLSAIPFVSVDDANASRTDRAIVDAQARLRTNNADDKARLDLAVAFLQKVRENADPTFYVNAQGLLDDLATRRSDDIEVLVARGTLALAQHRFADARVLGEQAAADAPGNPAALGILVDANNELGNYDAALDSTQRMVDARPSLASLARVSYARELRGDYAGAVEAMQQAVSAAGANGGENIAYVQTLLGQLLLTTHAVDDADAAFARAERAFPGFPAARAGRAQVLVAREKFSEAADLLEQVVAVQPLTQYASAWGDALTAAGRDEEAEHAYELVDVISRLFVANGVQLDLETALYDADHHPGPDAVARARAALAARPSTLAHDVLAWNLFQVGDLEGAHVESDQALALGSRDPQERYHAAEIAHALGDDAAARRHLQIVLAENPRFNARFIARIADLAQSLGIEMPAPAR